MPGLAPGPHVELLRDALTIEARGQRALLDGNRDDARRAFKDAADRYRASYDCAPPGGYGRLVGMLKALIISGDDEAVRQAARWAQTGTADAQDSPTVAYVRAIAALALAEEERARWSVAPMNEAGGAFQRAARAITAIVDRDEDACAAALAEIASDFETRQEHLTGVAIADTAIMLQRLAANRGMACALESPLVPKEIGEGRTAPK